MSLNIYDLDKIACETAWEKWIDYSVFEKTRNGILNHLDKKNLAFVHWTKYINSLQQLSTNFCQHINEEFSEDEVVKKLWFGFKRKVALILWKDRIISLWDYLRKISNLESWKPTTIEAIWRNKSRENDINNIYQEFFNEEEKRELLAIYTWIKAHIRRNDWKTIDWDAIIESLKNEWYDDVANKFYINK